jgi:hypothetical protein
VPKRDTLPKDGIVRGTMMPDTPQCVTRADHVASNLRDHVLSRRDDTQSYRLTELR